MKEDEQSQAARLYVDKIKAPPIRSIARFLQQGSKKGGGGGHGG